MSGMQVITDKKWPVWADKIKDLLNDSTEDRSLSELATLLNIHPVHLSRNFSKYFSCNLGEYIRTLKIQRSLSMLSERDLSLTQIALQCNFADQSHFIRAFKTQNKITPSAYRKLFLKSQKC
jgi:AraC family transcriptional regulator